MQDGSPYYHEVSDFLPEVCMKLHAFIAASVPMHYFCFAHMQDESASSFSSEAEIIPVHGVTCPQHDFTVFNKKRRNTVIAVSLLHYS